MPSEYRTPSAYFSRRVPKYWDDDPDGPVWQPDVYPAAVLLAQRLGSGRLVDVGCGSGQKLVQYADSLEVVGIDFGQNIRSCRKDHAGVGRWLEDDLDEAGPLPVAGDDLTAAVLICADVIEHVRDPHVLLAKLRQALDVADILLISTPERELTHIDARGRYMGPPPNEAHVREWSIREFSSMLRRAGFQHGSVGLTRAHDGTTDLHSILGLYARTAALLDLAEDAVIDAEPPPAPLVRLRTHESGRCHS